MTEAHISSIIRKRRMSVTTIPIWSTPSPLTSLTSLLQVLETHVVNREESHRSSVLWTHVSNGGTISYGEFGHTRSKEFYKFTNNANLPQVLRKRRGR